MNKIKLTGVRNIPTTEEIDPDKEYILALKIIPVGEFTPTEKEDGKTFHLKVHSYEMLNAIGEKPIDIKQGVSRSQQLRWLIEHELGLDYDQEMEKILNHYRNKLTQD